MTATATGLVSGDPGRPSHWIRSALLRHRGALAVAPVVFIAAVIITAVAGSAGQDPAGSPPGVALAATYRTAPAFSRPLLSGPARAGVRAHPGRITVLTFWSSWCTACRTEATMLRKVSADYRPKGVRFLGVDHRDRRAAAVSFAREHDLGYASVVDRDGSLLASYRGVGMPSTFVIDRDGIVRFAAAGTPDPASLRRALDLLRRGSAG